MRRGLQENTTVNNEHKCKRTSVSGHSPNQGAQLRQTAASPSNLLLILLFKVSPNFSLQSHQQRLNYSQSLPKSLLGPGIMYPTARLLYSPRSVKSPSMSACPGRNACSCFHLEQTHRPSTCQERLWLCLGPSAQHLSSTQQELIASYMPSGALHTEVILH